MSAQMAPALLGLPGCTGIIAAKLLAEIGPIERFRSDAQTRSTRRRRRTARGKLRPDTTPPALPLRQPPNSTAPFHRIAITQARIHPAAGAYIARKKAEGKSNREAIRCLERQLARNWRRRVASRSPRLPSGEPDS